MNIIDSFRLDGRVALVTGAGKGIGEGIAMGLAEAEKFGQPRDVAGLAVFLASPLRTTSPAKRFRWTAASLPGTRGRRHNHRPEGLAQGYE